MYGRGRYNRRYRSQVWIIVLCRNDVKVEPMPLIITGIIVALFFDFVNGFHDAANAIATVVGTRVLKPIQAVGMAAQLILSVLLFLVLLSQLLWVRELYNLIFQLLKLF